MSFFSISKQITCKKERTALINSLTEPPLTLGGFKYTKVKQRRDRLELLAVNEYPMLRNAGIPRILLQLTPQGQGLSLSLTLRPYRGVLIIGSIMSLLLIAMGVGMLVSVCKGEIEPWFVSLIPWLILLFLHGMLLTAFHLSAGRLLKRIEKRLKTSSLVVPFQK